jgi:epsin
VKYTIYCVLFSIPAYSRRSCFLTNHLIIPFFHNTCLFYSIVNVITQIMWESMENQRPAAWRVVFKGLTLLEHLLKNGSERCVDDARNHSHTLRSLHQFNYYEGTVDRGLGVREKSKQIVEILSDDERVREERQKARKLREKFGGNLGGVSGGGSKYAGYGNDSSSGGYGDSGIDSSSYRTGGGGGYGDSGGYSGRYADEGDAPASSSTPTFASLPEDKPKKIKSKKLKKKKKAAEEEPAPAPAAPGELMFASMHKVLYNSYDSTRIST